MSTATEAATLRSQTPSPNTSRRRSIALMNLQLNESSSLPSGEMINEGQVSSYRTRSPHSPVGSPTITVVESQRCRRPSLREIHQQLEQEQAAQSSLFQMIQNQQQQLQQLQTASGQLDTPTTMDSAPISEHSISFPNVPVTQPPTETRLSKNMMPRSPSTTLHPRNSFYLALADITRRSRTPSGAPSPILPSTSISNEDGEGSSLGTRDESAFYQAETQLVIRENQMLRMRLRELELQISKLHANSAITHEPARSSTLIRSQSMFPDGFTVGADKLIGECDGSKVNV